MARIVIIAILVAPLGLWALTCILRRLWATELVQSRVLRWTGHSYYVPTSWMHDRPTVRSGTHHDHSAALLVTFAAVWGSLVGSLSTGTCRSPARASAPAARNTSPRAAGLTVRPGEPAPVAHPGAGADTHRAATAGEDPDRPAVAADHQAGAP